MADKSFVFKPAYLERVHVAIEIYKFIDLTLLNKPEDEEMRIKLVYIASDWVISTEKKLGDYYKSLYPTTLIFTNPDYTEVVDSDE